LQQKKIFVLGFAFFVGDVVSATDLGYFRQGYWTLGPNYKMEVFLSSS